VIYGYARVSTAAQDLDGQLAQLRAAGCERVFREKITGTHAERPQLKRMLDALAPGDLVVTPAVDRISRDTTDLLVIAREIEKLTPHQRREAVRRCARLPGATTSTTARYRGSGPPPHDVHIGLTAGAWRSRHGFPFLRGEHLTGRE
jgi:hypothetical protein